jgi:hypothetical protein
MIKFTDQYFWNILFLSFFLFVVVMAAIILDTEARMSYADIGLLEGSLILLATWRTVRLLSVDSTTKFFREQFYDLKKTARTYSLEVPAKGPRRAFLELLLNPWNLSLGVGALLTFLYLLTSYMVYPLVILALSGLVAILELVTNWLTKKTDEE